MIEQKLPFGLKAGKLVEVSEVDQGIECDCVCPGCGHPLIARKGKKVIHHFAHYKSSECAAALETALHLAAKDILEKHMKIRIPQVIAPISIGGGDVITLYNEQTLRFDKVFLEKRLNGLTPDVIIEIKGKPLFIEIAVTHFIDEEKENKIKLLNVSTIEIDLSKIDRLITIRELEKILIEDLEGKRWVYNAKQNAFHNEIRQLGEKYSVVQRGMASHIDNCPIAVREWKGKSYANLTDDCFYCKYFFEEHGDGFTSHTHITCIGKAREKIDDVIQWHKKI